MLSLTQRLEVFLFHKEVCDKCMFSQREPLHCRPLLKIHTFWQTSCGYGPRCTHDLIWMCKLATQYRALCKKVISEMLLWGLFSLAQFSLPQHDKETLSNWKDLSLVCAWTVFRSLGLRKKLLAKLIGSNDSEKSSFILQVHSKKS